MSLGANEQLPLIKENYKLRVTNQFLKKLNQKVNTKVIGQYYKYLKEDGKEVHAILQRGKKKPFYRLGGTSKPTKQPLWDLHRQNAKI